MTDARWPGWPFQSTDARVVPQPAERQASRMTEDEIYARDWWCPQCRASVPPEMVTKDAEHYRESGGCGHPVRGELKEAQS